MRLITIAAVVIMLGFLSLGFMHEQAHVEIMRSYGIDSHVEYFSHFPGIATIYEKPCPNESCELANNLNEVVGYPLLVFYTVFSILLLIIIKQKDIQ